MYITAAVRAGDCAVPLLYDLGGGDDGKDVGGGGGLVSVSLARTLGCSTILDTPLGGSYANSTYLVLSLRALIEQVR